MLGGETRVPEEKRIADVFKAAKEKYGFTDKDFENAAIENIMKEKGLNREQAWSVYKNRQEIKESKRLLDRAVDNYKPKGKDNLLDKKKQKTEKTMEEEERELNPYLIEHGVYEVNSKGTPTGKIFYNRFGKLLLEEDGSNYKVLKDTQEILKHNGICYEKGGEQTLRQRACELLGDDYSDHKLRELFSFIKSYKLTDREDFNKDPNLIPLHNGILNINTMTLRPYTPEDLYTIYSPVDYDPTAQCPQWTQFLSDVLYLDDIDFVQEYMGYQYWRRNPWAILIIILGHGRNGKTVYSNINTAILGKDNVSHVPLQQIAEDRFASVDLNHKLANICGEISSIDLEDISQIKAITGNDPIRMQQKHENAFYEYIYAKLTFSANVMPEIREKSLAATERFVIIEFPNTFPRGSPECDPYIEDKLKTELPGIFNWAMQGLQRLLKKQTFSPYRDFQNVAAYIKANSHPVNQFIAKHIRANLGNEISKEEIHTKFLQFAVANKLHTIASNHFTSQFKQYLTINNIAYSDGRSRTEGHSNKWYDIEYYDDENQQEPPKKGQQELTDTPIDQLPEWTPGEIAAGMDKLKQLNPTDLPHIEEE